VFGYAVSSRVEGVASLPEWFTVSLGWNWRSVGWYAIGSQKFHVHNFWCVQDKPGFQSSALIFLFWFGFFLFCFVLFCFLLFRERINFLEERERKRNHSSVAQWHGNHSSQALGDVLCYKKLI
jgi:hypothetical protein